MLTCNDLFLVCLRLRLCLLLSLSVVVSVCCCLCLLSLSVREQSVPGVGGVDDCVHLAFVGMLLHVPDVPHLVRFVFRFCPYVCSECKLCLRECVNFAVNCACCWFLLFVGCVAVCIFSLLDRLVARGAKLGCGRGRG